MFDHREVGDAVWSRFSTRNAADVRWYYRGLLDAFAARSDDLGPGGRRALEEFRRTVDELG